MVVEDEKEKDEEEGEENRREEIDIDKGGGVIHRTEVKGEKRKEILDILEMAITYNDNEGKRGRVDLEDE